VAQTSRVAQTSFCMSALRAFVRCARIATPAMLRINAAVTAPLSPEVAGRREITAYGKMRRLRPLPSR
jgi:hypothetical protein